MNLSLGDQRLIVITPVYEDLEASSQLVAELRDTFADDLYVVAVDDGSVKQPLSIEIFEDADVAGTVVKLRRNVGHQAAIAIGIGLVAEQIEDYQQVVIMDSDGEDIPSTAKNLLASLSDSNTDIAVASRISRVETWTFKAFYAVYKRLFKLLSGRTISFGNFMALKPAAVRRLAAMHETSTHVAAATIASRLRLTQVPLHRGPRFAGKSKMNFISLALHGFKALMIFAEDVLVRVGVASAIVAAGSMAGIVTAVVLKSIGFATPGWFSVALGILFLILVQTGTLILLMLMLTGVMRGKSAVTASDYTVFVDQILPHRRKPDAQIS